mmetsp:Transcript_96042/g.200636  ORF Transcript_96042/g.200636 Transcript_96042/m.200636 type:complete len:117 (+) Transcript_96042:454-804(+)
MVQLHAPMHRKQFSGCERSGQLLSHLALGLSSHPRGGASSDHNNNPSDDAPGLAGPYCHIAAIAHATPDAPDCDTCATHHGPDSDDHDDIDHPGGQYSGRSSAAADSRPTCAAFGQ